MARRVRRRAARLSSALVEFFAAETSGAVALLVATVAALAIANSPLHAAFDALAHARMGFSAGWFESPQTLKHWIDDALMVIFFFVVGLEIKRELVEGELSSRRSALLPVVAAAGGMLAPAAIYLMLNAEGVSARGWGIPMATDIAFALGALALLGDRVPQGLRVFLVALAIVDDIGAIVVIALFYSAKIVVPALVLAFALLALLVVLNRFDVRSPVPYLVVGFGVWAAMLVSGVHSTIAGVLVAFTIPVDSGAGPLRRLESTLHPFSTFVVLPLFALVNAGVRVVGGGVFDALAQPVALGVVLGLVLGKPLGIAGASWIAIRTGVCELPQSAGWRHMVGAGMLGGIGFTMSLFVANLAFRGSSHGLTDAKLAILTASVLAAAIGCSWLVALRPLGDAETT